MSDQYENKRERRNALSDLSKVWSNANKSSPQQYYNQLAQRIRELEGEIAPDFHVCQLSSAHPPFTPMTPCSNGSSFGIPTYPYSRSFSMNVISPNSPIPTQKYGLSARILERAHDIPERFEIKSY